MTETAFNFWQHWYPIAPVIDLDSRRPTPIMLLGQRFVVWNAGTVGGASRDGAATKSTSTATNAALFRVFRDQCPHRLAPLSEGRVDEKTGHLMCSYHGWQFDAEGVCTRIPQADDPNIVTRNRDRYCVEALPTQVANGLLWVWPDTASAAQAHEHPLPLSEQVETEGFVATSMVRDLAYDWQTLIENVADPAHVQFAHHGLQGARDRGQSIPIEVIQSTPDCIEVTINRMPKTRILFMPPSHVEYEIHFDAER